MARLDSSTSGEDADEGRHEGCDPAGCDETRIAEVMSENADDPTFDRYSALAAIEAEDMT